LLFHVVKFKLYVSIYRRCQRFPADVIRGGPNGGCLRLISFYFKISTYSSSKCRIIPLWHCANCLNNLNNPILNADESVIYPILQSSRLAQNESIKKKIYIYILYKNILFYYLLFFVYSIQHTRKMLLLDNR
jgi:hypothetical protein